MSPRPDRTQEKPRPDSRQARGAATRRALMRSAEKLISEQGMGRVTIREILADAQQKNTSALQYHFGNLHGLVAAIQEERAEEIQARRAELIEQLLSRTPEPSLRQICALMVQPTFELAGSQTGFRRYIRAFGHELALSESSALSRVSRGGGGGQSGHRLGTLLRAALPHLNESAYRRRLESAVRLCAASMYHQARQKNAFRGGPAELYLNSLIDALVGLLSAPESAETRAIAETLEPR